MDNRPVQHQGICKGGPLDGKALIDRKTEVYLVSAPPWHVARDMTGIHAMPPRIKGYYAHHEGAWIWNETP